MKLPGELSSVDVDGVDFCGVLLEQAIGEAAGGSADVEADEACGSNREVFESAFEFEAAATGEFEMAAFDVELSIVWYGHACFFHDNIFYAHFASEDHGLGFLLGFGETALDEEKIEAGARGFGFHSAVNASGAALDEVFRDFAEARGALAEVSEFGGGFRRELAGDLMRAIEAIDSGIGGFLLSDVFAGGFAEGSGSFFDVENVVGDLKEEAEGFAEPAEASDVFVRRASAHCAGSDGSADECGSFGAMDVFEHVGIDALAGGFKVGDLAANHSVDGASAGGDFGEHGDAASGVNGSSGDRFEREREKSIAGEDGGGFAKFFVIGGLAATEVVIVESGKVVVNERVGVNEFESAGGIVGGRDVGVEDAGGFNAEDGANALAAGEDAVAHGLMDGRRLCGFGGHEAVERGVDSEAVFFEEGGRFHC